MKNDLGRRENEEGKEAWGIQEEDMLGKGLIPPCSVAEPRY